MKRFLTAAVAAFAVAACGDSATEPNQESFTYDLTVTGGLEAELSGPAFFGADTDEENNEVFSILMGSDTSSYIVMLAREGTTRPAVGTYEIADAEATGEQWAAMVFASEGEELIDIFVSEGGELTITESSTQRLRGSLEFTATGFLGAAAEPVEITVSGTFSARRVQ